MRAGAESETVDAAPPVTVSASREEVVLGCPGSRRAATFVNRRYVRIRCTQKRCRRADGARVYHLWDSVTGRLVDTETEQDGRVLRPERSAS